MKAPQIIMICLFVTGFCTAVFKHGEDKGKYNLWSYLFTTAIYVLILIWGGFFK
jgi:hypothetical protein